MEQTNSPASSCSNSGTRLSAGPKSISTIALITSEAVMDLPERARAWSCELTVSDVRECREGKSSRVC